MRKTWELIRPTFVLVVICLIISALLALTYNLAGVAELANAGYSTEQLAEFASTALPEADELKKVDVSLEDEDLHSVYKAQNGTGMAIVVTTKGYHELTVMYGFDNGGVLRGVHVIAQEETPGIGDKVVKDTDYLSCFGGQTADSFTVDVVAGASKTSNGLINGAKRAFELFEELKGEVLGQ